MSQTYLENVPKHFKLHFQPILNVVVKLVNAVALERKAHDKKYQDIRVAGIER